MITLVVPTRNRAHTIRLVGESFYRQAKVTEIIFVDDGGTDDSAAVIASLAARFPEIETHVLRNERRCGAAASRIRGYEAARNDLILYCDDDVYLEPYYAATCLEKMQRTGAAIVSGRLVHKEPEETPDQAISRFGFGNSSLPVFRRIVCEFRVNARFTGDIKLPITHSVILTRRDLLRRFSYDPFYSKGNGYREESDFQMNAFVNGYDVVVTNDVHCVELSRRENPSGGQRVSRLQRLFWNVYYTNYFFRKYYGRYARRIGLKLTWPIASALFAVYQLWVLFVRPAFKLLPRSRPVQERKRRLGMSVSQVE